MAKEKAAKSEKGKKAAGDAKGKKAAGDAKGKKAAGDAKGKKAAGGGKGAEARGGKKKAAASGAHEPGPDPRIRKHYLEKVVPELIKAFKYKNVMQVPKLEKIVVNMGVGEAIQNPKTLDAAQSDLAKITGQKPSIRRARKSIANFKLREGQAVGCAVTLRGSVMYEFYDRLVSIAIPRVRDFRGTPSKSFDGRGNYTFGLTEQIVFPEIDYDKVDKIRGMDITIVTSARTDDEGRELLKLMKMPFRAR
jgi:large subunit ribosomal protein L5